MICHLFRQTILIGLQERPDACEPHLLLVELALQVISLGELVLHVILHRADLLGGLGHLLVDSALKILYLFKIVVDGLLLHLESGSRRL
jgi:hypothetical protein